MLRVFRRWIPVTNDYEGGKFFVRRPGLYATPLLIVLLVVETTDLLFRRGFNSRSAGHHAERVHRLHLERVRHPGTAFHVFCLAGMMEVFHYLHYGLSIVLMFVGAKMLASDYYSDSHAYALGVVAGVLLISVLASVLHPKKASV